MSAIAALPMYDWSENRAETDARWAALRPRLIAHGIDAPRHLTRSADAKDIWLSPSLIVAETCTYPLATFLSGHVRYVATPLHDAPGFSPDGTYRSAIIAQGTGDDAPVPENGDAALSGLTGRFAANAPDSLSGYVALKRDLLEAGHKRPDEVNATWTSSHRQSIRAVASGEADYAAIDCVSFALARRHEPAARMVRIAGWTRPRPALPLVTRKTLSNDALKILQRAICEAIPAIVLDDPLHEPTGIG